MVMVQARQLTGLDLILKKSRAVKAQCSSDRINLGLLALRLSQLQAKPPVQHPYNRDQEKNRGSYIKSCEIRALASSDMDPRHHRCFVSLEFRHSVQQPAT